MYAVPFSIQFDNSEVYLKNPSMSEFTWDTLGVLRFSASRRKKGIVNVHINVGAGFELIGNYTSEEIQQHSNYYFLGEWLEQTGQLEEMTGVEMLTRKIPVEIRQEEFNRDLLRGLGKVRIW